MRAGRMLAGLGAGVLVAGPAACALDFARFESDAGPLESQDATNPSAGDSNAGAQGDAGADVTVDEADTTADADATADAAPDGGPLTDAPCTPSPSCIMSAQTCGAACARTEQQCKTTCLSGTCRQNCTRTGTACITQCETTCSSCTQSGGCSAASACADAAQ